MAFTHDTTTDEGQVRTLIFDTDSTDYYFEDDEIIGILDLNSDDIHATAADLCRSIAAKLGKKAFKIGLGKKDVEVDKTKTPSFYLQLASTYDRKSGSDVIEFIDSANINVDLNGIDNTEYIGD